MERTKFLTANGYSLEASFKFDEETNVLDMDVNLTAGMYVNIEYNEGKYDVIRTKYKPEEYAGSWENMPEFRKWLDASSMMRVLYGFYNKKRTERCHAFRLAYECSLYLLILKYSKYISFCKP